MTRYEFSPIGYVRTEAKTVPRFYRISDVRGTLQIDDRFREGLREIQAGDRIIVVFLFHQSPPFEDAYLRVTPPRRNEPRGVFSTRSPVRPNPIGISELEVLGVEEGSLQVKGLDMVDGSPILDIKPVQ
jgi:tRNA (adenine37-N6)-methyltransferase